MKPDAAGPRPYLPLRIFPVGGYVYLAPGAEVSHGDIYVGEPGIGSRVLVLLWEHDVGAQLYFSVGDTAQGAPPIVGARYLVCICTVPIAQIHLSALLVAVTSAAGVDPK